MKFKVCPEYFRDLFTIRAITNLNKKGSCDMIINDIEIDSITNCERCGAPVDKMKLIMENNPKKSSICLYCGCSIIKGFVFYFPEVNYYGEYENYVSISNTSENLFNREAER